MSSQAVTSRFWPWLRPVAWFLAALMGLDLAILTTADHWQRHSPDGYEERIDGCAQSARDLVCLGGSPVTEGIDPTFFVGLRWQSQPIVSAYSIGLPGATTTDFYYALKRACPHPPRLILYGIAPSDLNDSRNEPHGIASVLTTADVIDSLQTRPELTEWTIRQSVETRLGRVWSAYRYRHGLRMASALSLEDLAPGSCPEAAHEARQNRAHADDLKSGSGYAPAAWFASRRYDHVKATNAPQAPFPFLNRYKTGEHLRYLDRIRDWAEAQNATLVLIDMPTTADLEIQYPQVISEYRARLDAFVIRTSTSILRASRTEVGLTDADFADLIHLNRSGAATLSQWIRDRIGEMAP